MRLQEIKKIMKENEKYLMMLEEFDRTGHLPTEKIRRSFTLKRSVFRKLKEVSKRKRKGMSELLEGLIEENFVMVKETFSKAEMPNLHVGELKAIALCNELKVKNLLIDEKEGYKAAELVGLNPLRTTALLLRLLNKKIIKFEEYKESLLALSESGYFLSAETYERLLEAGRKI